MALDKKLHFTGFALPR